MKMSELNGNKSFTGTSLRLKVGLAEMLKGGVIMDVMNVEQARIAEESGAASVMALDTYPIGVSETRIQRVADVMAQFGLLYQRFDVSSMILPSSAFNFTPFSTPNG